jgi:hypothetical protein
MTGSVQVCFLRLAAEAQLVEQSTSDPKFYDSNPAAATTARKNANTLKKVLIFPYFSPGASGSWI